MKVSGGKSKVDRNSDLHFSGRTGIPTDSPTTPSGVGFFLDDTQESRDGSLGKFQNNEGPGTESYQSIYENKFQHPEHNPLSTFSIDVDTASYANVRRFLTVQNTLPPANAIRIEELINYFAYGDAQPTDGRPLAVRLEVAACPWSLQNKLVRVSMKGKEIAAEERRITNLVFLIDVSGSMSDQNKLPLLKEGLRLLVRQLTENDRVAIVTYAGTSGVALPSTNASQRDKIMSVIDSLEAGGSTNGEAGIQMAYEQATANFIQKGVNRVILMTDGDFNVGVTDSNQLNTMIADKAKSGVFLSVLGFGMGNLKDSTMERLADKGNGNYAYIDSLREARKVLVDQMNGTLVTIAKDVKIQVEFNPAKVSAYRLIGYEDRALTAADFNNDKKDAGELGAGHGVTALYEIVPVGVQGGEGTVQVDALKYQNPAPQRAAPKVQNDSIELLTAKIRYKMPDADTSVAFEVPLNDSNKSYTSASVDFKFSAAVASFGMLLRGSQYKGTANWDAVLELAEESKGADALGYRREFIDLVMKAKSLAGNASK
ncbi:MAG: VWA domain-containing protein [Planctomycetes bacterium]|nr:VWA domain-containing protein [Planctomycetota bacterium]